MIITPEEFASEMRREYTFSEVEDIVRERQREARKLDLRHLRCPRPMARRWAGGYSSAAYGAGRLNGMYGLLIMAIREGLTVRGYYNLSVPAGVTVSGGLLTDLLDLHTSGNDYAQATVADQPTFTLNDAAIRGNAQATGDGTSDNLACTTYSTPAPGTTTVYIRALINQITWTAGDNFWNSNSATIACSMSQNPTASPNIRMNNGAAANGNGGLAVNTWGRVEEQFQNSTADYVKAVTTVATGVSGGNNSAGTGRRLFCGSGASPASFSNMALAYLLSCEGDAGAATGRFRSFADWWTTVTYGPGLV